MFGCTRSSRRGTVWALVALLALGCLGSGLAAPGAVSAGASEARCVLSVASEPSGAAVYVDGVMQGVTPLRLEVTAG